MIENLLNNSINKVTSDLFLTKDQILSAAKNRSQEEVINKLPSPEQFKSDLESTILNGNQEDLVKLENKFNQAVRSIDIAIDKLTQKENQLFTLKTKLEGSRQQLNLIGNIRDIGFNLSSILEGLIPIIDGALATSSGPVASGTLISNLTLFKKDFKDIIKKIQGILSSIDGINGFFGNEINLLINPLNTGINSLGIAIQKLKDLREQFLFNYESFLDQILVEEDFDNLGISGTSIIGYLEGQSSKGGSSKEDSGNEDSTSTVLTDIYGTGEGNENSTSLVYKGFKR
jgi:hypothetical protein